MLVHFLPRLPNRPSGCRIESTATRFPGIANGCLYGMLQVCYSWTSDLSRVAAIKTMHHNQQGVSVMCTYVPLQDLSFWLLFFCHASGSWFMLTTASFACLYSGSCFLIIPFITATSSVCARMGRRTKVFAVQVRHNWPFLAAIPCV